MSQTATPSMPPTVMVQADRGWVSLDLAEMWQHRDLLMNLTMRDIKVRYKQTAAGVVWVILQPLVAALLFAFVFGNVAKLEAPAGMPYLVFVFCGVTFYTLFNKSVTKAASSLVINANLVSKIYFPRLMLPISAALGNLVDFAVAVGVLIVLMAIMFPVVVPAVVFTPLLLILLMMLALGIGMAAAALAVPYRDVNYALPVIVQLMMWGSPVVYDLGKVPTEPLARHLAEGWRDTWLGSMLGNTSALDIYLLNPLASIFEAIRYCVLGQGIVYPGYLIYSIVVCIVVFIAGLLAFKRMERSFADVI